jgi:DNA invertase Pin-like site-specific DNA recombinase
VYNLAAMASEWFSSIVEEAGAAAASRRQTTNGTSRSSARPRMVGIIRVSEVGDREGERFISPIDQRKRLEGWQREFDAIMVELLEEIDVSGKLPIAKRPGLRRGIELIETGQADVLVFAYRDRNFRNTIVEMETIARINAAGGKVFSVGFGEIRIDTASQWFSTIVQAAANELLSRSTSEKVINAKREAIARGVPPFPRIPPGYRRGDDGRLVVHPEEAVAVADAFRMRADLVPMTQIRKRLAEQGVILSYSGIKEMLKSRIVLGELHAGKFSNLDAHPAIVDRALWQRVQRTKLPRGPAAKSEGGLLSRMGILRCSGCGYAMSRSATQRSHGKWFPIYRCSMMGDCPRPVTIGAALVERLVAERLLAEQELQGVEGTASRDMQIRQAEDELAKRQAALEAFVEAFEGLDIAATRKRSAELQHEVEEADDRLAVLRAAAGPAEIVSLDRGWEHATLDRRRRLIRATWKSITVLPAPRQGRYGRGDEAGRARLAFDPLIK